MKQSGLPASSEGSSAAKRDTNSGGRGHHSDQTQEVTSWKANDLMASHHCKSIRQKRWGRHREGKHDSYNSVFIGKDAYKHIITYTYTRYIYIYTIIHIYIT